MDEFAKLFLTGKRAGGMERFRRVVAAIGFAGSLLAFLPVLLSLFLKNPPLPLSIAFSVTGLILGTASSVLNYYRTTYARGLIEAQHGANGTELRGDERERHEKLYAAWKESFEKQNKRRKVAVFFAVFAYFLLALSYIAFEIGSLPDVFLVVACILFSVFLLISVGTWSMADARTRAALYERAEREIEDLKRERLGMSEKTIAAESENARAFSSIPLSVAMFLKDETDKAEFAAAAKKSGIAGFAFGFGLGILLFASSIAGIAWEQLGMATSWTIAGVVLVAAFTAYMTFLLPLERRKKEIYRRNLDKLGESETDGIRKELQGAWCRLQSAGNIMFACFFAGAVVLGAVFGIVAYVTDPGAALAECLGGGVMAFLIPAAILSLIVWFVIFTIYRRRVRPVEARLKAAEKEGK